MPISNGELIYKQKEGWDDTGSGVYIWARLVFQCPRSAQVYAAEMTRPASKVVKKLIESGATFFVGQYGKVPAIGYSMMRPMQSSSLVGYSGRMVRCVKLEGENPDFPERSTNPLRVYTKKARRT
jgi:hypothetical protein